MFNDTKIKQLSLLVGVDDLKLLEKGLKKQASYLGVSSSYLLKSFVVLHNIKKEYEDEKVKIEKYHTKNIKVAKQKELIVNLYSYKGYGYLKISKYLKLHHNLSISKSTIEHFIKSNNITREDWILANLKGGYIKNSNNSTGFIKQIRDLNFRLAAFGESRYKNPTSKSTHSIETAKKRDEFAKSFAKYIENKYDNLEGKKLNEFFDNHHIKEFLDERTENLSVVSKESYIRSFSSMLQGLSQNNISMNYDISLFDKMVESLKKENPKPTIQTNRAIKDTDTLIKNIAKENYSASIISKVQIEMGYRVSEAVEVVKNFSKYFDSVSNTIKNVSGKAGHIYKPKPISSSLIAKIKSLTNEKIISKRAYQKILSKFRVKSHDFRFTYALNSFNSLIKSGKSYDTVLLEVSSQLNHKRAGMTRYYLKRC